jgi:hypothetical protein
MTVAKSPEHKFAQLFQAEVDIDTIAKYEETDYIEKSIPHMKRKNLLKMKNS